MSARPIVSVFNHNTANEVAGQVKLPSVFSAPLRHDIVSVVHENISRNSRQAHGINFFAGMKHSSLSWGTGRAVSRIPRIRGSGTNRTGQGANGNMCRAGRMAFPLRTWRRWHRKVNVKQRRYALAAAIAASSVTPLVLARGHRVMNVPQLPLIFSDDINSIAQTKEAIAVFEKYGILDDVNRVVRAKKIRAGRGKLRNRRWKRRRGPLFIGDDKSGNLKRALANIPGVDFINVNRLNLRHLAPGGHLGRFTIWTQSAIQSLNDHFGGFKGSAKLKKGFHLANSVIAFADIAQIINSNEIQSALNPVKPQPRRTRTTKKNPLKNKKMMKRLNPYAEVLAEQRRENPGVKKAIDKSKRKELRTRSKTLLKAALARVNNSIEAAAQEFKELAAETMI